MKMISTALIACALGCLVHCPAAKAQTETVLYSFCSQQSCTDGSTPDAGLINIKGTLYGTTSEGGTYGEGTVFSLDLNTGAETVLHSFGSGTDGSYPQAGLINIKGTLYGTTTGGGTYGVGTVFSLDPKLGSETVLYSFGHGRDGAYPVAGLIDVKGTLYGTTEEGGTDSLGTAFSLDLNTGTETVLHSFGSGTDGADPEAGLINIKGTLYGTTEVGGTDSAGTVFSLNPDTGAETLLYSFCSQQNCADGTNPGAGLIDVKRTLYGTTQYDGAVNDGEYGEVFSLKLNTDAEKVSHSFNGTDGANPVAGLIDVKRTLYKTTGGGGTDSSGTAFSLNPSTGAETVLYSLCSQQNCKNGANPGAGLIDVKHTLYGTTETGGASGGGTVFSITP